MDIDKTTKRDFLKVCKERIWGRDRKEDDKMLDILWIIMNRKRGRRKKND